ncbi:MAG: hypothetical protein PHT40_01050 [Patescibacteria group bacterium]|nr:hypothetical protein [Patescibacteria group bacterium]
MKTDTFLRMVYNFLKSLFKSKKHPKTRSGESYIIADTNYMDELEPTTKFGDIAEVTDAQKNGEETGEVQYNIHLLKLHLNE